MLGKEVYLGFEGDLETCVATVVVCMYPHPTPFIIGITFYLYLITWFILVMHSACVLVVFS